MASDRPRVQDVHSKRISTMGRRRFMKTLTGAGFTTAAASYLTAEDVQAAASDEIPIVAGIEPDPDDPSNEIPYTKNVPADWYNDYRHAVNVFEREREELMEVRDAKAVWFEPGEYQEFGTTVCVHETGG